jgi:hypothetical protein
LQDDRRFLLFGNSKEEQTTQVKPWDGKPISIRVHDALPMLRSMICSTRSPSMAGLRPVVAYDADHPPTTMSMRPQRPGSSRGSKVDTREISSRACDVARCTECDKMRTRAGNAHSSGIGGGPVGLVAANNADSLRSYLLYGDAASTSFQKRRWHLWRISTRESILWLGCVGSLVFIYIIAGRAALLLM